MSEPGANDIKRPFAIVLATILIGVTIVLQLGLAFYWGVVYTPVPELTDLDLILGTCYLMQTAVGALLIYPVYSGSRIGHGIAVGYTVMVAVSPITTFLFHWGTPAIFFPALALCVGLFVSLVAPSGWRFSTAVTRARNRNRPETGGSNSTP